MRRTKKCPEQSLKTGEQRLIYYIPLFQQYFKPVATKAAWYTYKIRHLDQFSGGEEPTHKKSGNG